MNSANRLLFILGDLNIKIAILQNAILQNPLLLVMSLFTAVSSCQPVVTLIEFANLQSWKPHERIESSDTHHAGRRLCRRHVLVLLYCYPTCILFLLVDWYHEDKETGPDWITITERDIWQIKDVRGE